MIAIHLITAEGTESKKEISFLVLHNLSGLVKSHLNFHIYMHSC